MSWTGGTASIGATRRIRTFSIGVWMLGSIVLAIFTSSALIGYVFVAEYGTNEDPPWRVAEPTQAVSTDGGSTWSATGDAVLRMPDEITSDGPVMVTLKSLDDQFLRLFHSRSTDDPAIDWPDMVGFLDSSVSPQTVIVGGEDSVLWVQANGNWSLSLTPLEAREIVDTVSGSGDEYLVYRGDSLSASASHLGTGVFSVDIYGDFGVDYAIIENDRVDQRFSWDTSSAIVLHVRSTAGDGAWSITIDGAETPAGATPSGDPQTAEPEDW